MFLAFLFMFYFYYYYYCSLSLDLCLTFSVLCWPIINLLPNAVFWMLFPIHADSHKLYCYVWAMKPLTCETFKHASWMGLLSLNEWPQSLGALSLQAYCHTHQLYSTNTVPQVFLHSQHCLCCNISYQLMICTGMDMDSLICQHH